MKLKKALPMGLKTSDTPGVITGRASVYGNVDSYGDRVMPGAFRKTLADKRGRVVVLSQHDPDQSIGTAILEDRNDGLHCRIELLLDIAQARDDYARVKAGLIDGLSIGYETVRETTTRDGVRELHEIRLWEVSIVTFAANQDAHITSVKRRTSATAALADLTRITGEMRQLGPLISMRAANRVLPGYLRPFFREDRRSDRVPETACESVPAARSAIVGHV